MALVPITDMVGLAGFVVGWQGTDSGWNIDSTGDYGAVVYDTEAEAREHLSLCAAEDGKVVLALISLR